MRAIIGATRCQVCGISGGELGLCKVCEHRLGQRVAATHRKDTRRLLDTVSLTLALGGLFMVALAYLAG